MSVKPSILSIYEKYYIPLGRDLEKCLPGLIIAVMPVLEELENEYFEAGYTILIALRTQVQATPFYNGLWGSIARNAAIRGSAVNFLMRALPKSTTPEDVVVICDSSNRFSDAMIALLTDQAFLVNRGALDILINNFSYATCHTLIPYVDSIVKESLSVLLKRQSSLNRRLFEWLQVDRLLAVESEAVKSIIRGLKVLTVNSRAESSQTMQ